MRPPLWPVYCFQTVGERLETSQRMPGVRRQGVSLATSHTRRRSLLSAISLLKLPRPTAQPPLSTDISVRHPPWSRRCDFTRGEPWIQDRTRFPEFLLVHTFLVRRNPSARIGPRLGESACRFSNSQRCHRYRSDSLHVSRLQVSHSHQIYSFFRLLSRSTAKD